MSRAMQLQAAIAGQLDDYMKGEAEAIPGAVRTVIDASTREVQAGWRNGVLAAFGGKRGAARMANAVRSQQFATDEGGSVGIVYSRLGRRDEVTGKFIDYLAPHVTGATLRPTDGGDWLYIPLGSGRRQRLSRRALQFDERLAFVPISGGRALLVQRTRRRTTIVALLVRSRRVPASLQFAAITAQTQAKLPGRLIAALEAKG